jgi:hypothetical protein
VKLLKSPLLNEVETNEETNLQHLAIRERQAREGAALKNYFFNRLLAVSPSGRGSV